MKRGFTLIELAIVIVIAGILAAIAVPIYNTLVEDAKWSEAKAACSTIRNQLNVYLTQNTGWDDPDTAAVEASTDLEGDITVWGPRIGVTADDLGNLKYFDPSNFTIGGTGGTTQADFTYVITADPTNGTTRPGAPSGTYTIDQSGITTGP